MSEAQVILKMIQKFGIAAWTYDVYNSKARDNEEFAVKIPLWKNVSVMLIYF